MEAVGFKYNWKKMEKSGLWLMFRREWQGLKKKNEEELHFDIRQQFEGGAVAYPIGSNSTEIFVLANISQIVTEMATGNVRRPDF